MKVYAVIVQGSLVEPFTNRAEAMSRRKELDAKGAFLEERDFALNKAGILDAITFAQSYMIQLPDEVPVDPELVGGPGQDTEGSTGANMDFDLDPVDAVGVDTEDDVFLTDDDEFDFDLDEDDLVDDEAQQKCCDTCTYVALTKDGQAYCDNELSEFRDKDVDPEISSCELWDSMT